jgi:hypothetical protein
MLSIISLAYWIMDDGYFDYHGRGLLLKWSSQQNYLIM